jgi:hypothetical protein
VLYKKLLELLKLNRLMKTLFHSNNNLNNNLRFRSKIVPKILKKLLNNGNSLRVRSRKTKTFLWMKELNKLLLEVRL